MKIVQINTTYGIGSTGKICVGIRQVLNAQNIENYVLCSNTNDVSSGIVCSDWKYIKFQALKSRVFGNYGFNSKKATKRMIDELERITPDIVHLHNIHGHDCNLDTLFAYFKKRHIKLIWTFHDCWAFTGYCPHFTMNKCDKWKIQCRDCVQRREYSWFFDNSTRLFEKKKSLFEGLNLTIVTPSKWLADIVKQSFLKDYPVKIINNGIDLTVFKIQQSDFRKKHRLESKKVLLGVSFGWDKRKGLDVFLKLAERLPDEYQIVLVGTNDFVDKELPNNILSIHRTQNQQELAEIYCAADLFVNPTKEETYPTVNMEALACGTPVLTFRSGGSPEIVDKTCGLAVDCDDVEALQRAIIRILNEKPFSQDACVNKSKAFDKNERFKDYVELYESVYSSEFQRG